MVFGTMELLGAGHIAFIREGGGWMSRELLYQPETARHVLVVVNPAAGMKTNRGAIGDLRERLAAAGIETEITGDLDHLRRRIADPSRSRLRAVVAAGGDGTVRAVINHTLPDVPIAILPLGTENLLAKYLRMQRGSGDLSDAIVRGATIRFDAGQAGGRVFMLMAGCGFDADVVRRLHERRKGHISHLSYLKPIFDSVRTYNYPTIRVRCDSIEGVNAAPGSAVCDGATTLTVRWLFVLNLPCYAMGLQVVPHAIGTDGALDVCGFENGSFLAGLRYLHGVIRGRHLTWPDCRYFRATKVWIESDAEVPYQLDGDPGGTLPLEISVLPERVSMIVTESWARRHGFSGAPRVSGQQFGQQFGQEMGHES